MTSNASRAARVLGTPLARLARAVVGQTATESPLAPVVLIVTSRHRLWQRYGPDGVHAIEEAIGQLLTAMAGRGLAGTPLYVDDSPLLTALGVLPADTGDADDIARVIRQVASRLAWTEEEARHVLILGDDGIVPFHRLPNPSDDDDPVVLSDHPYGADPKRPLGEARGVGRLPDAGIGPLLSALRAATEAHLRLAKGVAPALAPTSFGYSASIWKRAARGAYAAVGEPRELRLSPPLSHADAPQPGPDGPRFRYFNLHGLIDSPDWFGQVDPTFPASYPPFPVALQPAGMESTAGAVVVAECCYGAHLAGRGVDDSVALAHLADGALAFYGATGVAYGGLDGHLVAADLLAFHLWRGLIAGLPAGAALARAKTWLVAEAMQRQGYLDGEDEKTVAGFVLYGDPSLHHALPSEQITTAFDRAPMGEPSRVPWAHAPRGLARKAAAFDAPPAIYPGSIPGCAAPMIEVRPAALDDVTLERVRKTVAKRLPGLAATDVAIQVHAAARAAPLAKSMPDPTPGDAPAAVGARVVSLSRSIPTCAGPLCRTIVRVTVDRDGRIRKLSLTH